MSERIRVGFEEYAPEKLGFHYYEKIEVPGFRIHYLVRISTPLIIVKPAYPGAEKLTVADFARAEVPTMDYPTKPFLAMIRILERQIDMFAEHIRADGDTICCSALCYVADILGLLEFALNRRGRSIGVDIHYCCDAGKYITKNLLSEARREIDEASKPAPGLGNFTYVDIAERAYYLLRIVYTLSRLYNRSLHGCRCTC